jgi:hypothetical protein
MTDDREFELLAVAGFVHQQQLQQEEAQDEHRLRQPDHAPEYGTERRLGYAECKVGG